MKLVAGADSSTAATLAPASEDMPAALCSPESNLDRQGPGRSSGEQSGAGTDSTVQAAGRDGSSTLPLSASPLDSHRPLVKHLVGQRPRRLFGQCRYCGRPAQGRACTAHRPLLKLDPYEIVKGTM